MNNERFAPADWLLDYLEDQDHEKVAITFDEIARDSNFTADELRAAGSMCKDLGLITMSTDASRSMLIGGLTGEGRALVYSRKSVGDLLQYRNGLSTTSNTVNVTGDIHGGQVGINNEQTIIVQVTPEQVRNLIQALRHDGLTEVADAVDDETRGGKEPSRLIEGLRKGLSVAGDAGTVMTSLGAVGRALLDLLGAS